MRTLIVEDDFVSRKVLQQFLLPFGECDVSVDGMEALKAFQDAFEKGQPYELICLDVMMPALDGHAVLKGIRSFESERGVEISKGAKVIMTTALDDSSNVLGAFREGCEAYVVKPLDKQKLYHELRKLELIEVE